MKNGRFDHQGKRPDQVAHAEATAGACIILLVLAALLGFLTACGHGPTEPERQPVAIIDRLDRADTLVVTP